MNPIEVQRLRQGFKSSIRRFFADLNYLEVDTPILVTQPGTEAYLEYFSTVWRDYSGFPHSVYLRSSPELHMKQLVAAGGERIYQFATSFRNGGERAAWHHPEFLMLEWYQTNIRFDDFMDQTESLVRHCHLQLKQLCPKVRLAELPKTFHKISVTEAFSKFAGLTLIDGDPSFSQRARALGFHSVNSEDDFETAFFKVLIDVIEPAVKSLGAVFLYDYPPSQSALAMVEHGVAKRFELYLEGVEICNAFLELPSANGNVERMVDSNQKRAKLGKEVTSIDQEFVAALSQGLPLCCGNAMGLDRLLAVLLNHPNIDQVVPFRRARLFSQST